ncbi:MAG: hypothetical protein KC613_27115, partial [Myxococcales bacterium]|nr:hypothetical protein [Myxococcales bacterium]
MSVARRRACIVFSCALAGALGCTDEPPAAGESLKLALARAEAERRAAPVSDARQLADPATLRAALARPAHEVLPRLGGVEYSLTLSAQAVDTDGGGEQARFSDTVSLRVEPDGDFALIHDVDWAIAGDAQGQSGRRCVWFEGAWYTAGRHGPATRIPVRDDEPRRCLASGLAPLRDLLDRVVDELELSPSGPVEVLGRGAQRVVGLRAPRPAQVPPAVPEAWGEAHRERAIDSKAIFGPRGSLFAEATDLREAKVSLTLDDATGAPLEARVEAAFAFRKLSRNGRLAITLALQAQRPAGPVIPPANARVWGPRPRPFAELAAWTQAPKAEAADPALPGP